MTRVINSSEFQTEVLDNTDVVLIDFFAEWCRPCKMLAPAIEGLSKEMTGKAKVLKVDIDKSSDIAQNYRIMSVPTIMIFKDGKVVEKIVGFQPKEVLKNKLVEYLLWLK